MQWEFPLQHSGLRVRLQQLRSLWRHWSVLGLCSGLKDVALLQPWHRCQLEFNPWPRNFHMLQVQPLKKRRRKENAVKVFSQRHIRKPLLGKPPYPKSHSLRPSSRTRHRVRRVRPSPWAQSLNGCPKIIINKLCLSINKTLKPYNILLWILMYLLFHFSIVTTFWCFNV